MNVRKLKTRLWVVEEARLKVRSGKSLQTRSTVCRGLTFEGLVVKNIKQRYVAYQIHRHTERRIEFQTTGQEVIFEDKSSTQENNFEVMLSYRTFRLALFVIPQQSRFVRDSIAKHR